MRRDELRVEFQGFGVETLGHPGIPLSGAAVGRRRAVRAGQYLVGFGETRVQIDRALRGLAAAARICSSARYARASDTCAS